jgi:hypothetical protein
MAESLSDLLVSASRIGLDELADELEIVARLGHSVSFAVLVYHSSDFPHGSGNFLQFIHELINVDRLGGVRIREEELFELFTSSLKEQGGLIPFQTKGLLDHSQTEFLDEFNHLGESHEGIVIVKGLELEHLTSLPG